MNKIIKPYNQKFNNDEQPENETLKKQFLGAGLYIREDDQDWGSAGMNDFDK